MSEQVFSHKPVLLRECLEALNIRPDGVYLDGTLGRAGHSREIAARLTTGRTHQIRVHMASIGHPVLGDPVYGPKKSPYPVAGGRLLHAFQIGFVHPVTGEEMRFTSPPEPRFLEWLEKLRIR